MGRSTAVGPLSEGRTVAQRLGLSTTEYARIVELLGREPNFLELAVFSALWSEHCSYKTSLYWLRQLPRIEGRALKKAGEENAGVLALDSSWAVCFKVESHNHPSAVEPYQGAATGVGGIHRDIMALGARPIAALNSLRFGDPNRAHTHYLLKGIVKGIGNYGNAFGVPTVAGEIYFDPLYNDKPLVNAMSVGIVKIADLVSARACAPGYWVCVIGAYTGRDGVGGAAFASENLQDTTHAQLPAIQIGDPFRQKVLLEALQEMVQHHLIAAMQDMGAAGIASSCAEIAAKSNLGMKLHLDKVPLRQPDLAPHEILLSESQERMLILVSPDKYPHVQKICQKWEIACEVFGEVIPTPNLIYLWHGEKVGQIPSAALQAGQGSPVYMYPYTATNREKFLPYLAPPYVHGREPLFEWQFPPGSEIPFSKNVFYPEAWDFGKAQTIPMPDINPISLEKVIDILFADPNLLSKKYIYEQYDSFVGAHTLSAYLPTSAGIVQIPYTEMSVGLRLDGNPYPAKSFAFFGVQCVVAEAARNVLCSGHIPIGLTNCLNYGNPTDPGVYTDFVESIMGLGWAAWQLNLPITGGNVSLYNHTAEGPVPPTPVVGVVGLREGKLTQLPQNAMPAEGEIFLLGPMPTSLGSSVYKRHTFPEETDFPPTLHWSAEKKLYRILPQLWEKVYPLALEDVSDGGLLWALMEMCVRSEHGAYLQIPDSLPLRWDVFFLSEDASRILVVLPPTHVHFLKSLAHHENMPLLHLGRAQKEPTFTLVWQGKTSTFDLRPWKERYENFTFA
ncbi:MAG: phosphoribosylformylglycinamidine synthase subunit PurL [Bacteroidia bacterium]